MLRKLYEKLTGWLRERHEDKLEREFWEKHARLEREAEEREIEQYRAKLKKAGIFYDA